MASSWLLMMSFVALNCLPGRAGVVPRTQTQGNVYLSYLDTKGRTSERMVTRPDVSSQGEGEEREGGKKERKKSRDRLRKIKGTKELTEKWKRKGEGREKGEQE